MGRSYAGILGVIAMTATVVRGAIAGYSPDGTLLAATIHLFAFAAAGWMLGTIAQHTIDTSVRTRFEAELKAAETAAAAHASGKTSATAARFT